MPPSTPAVRAAMARHLRRPAAAATVLAAGYLLVGLLWIGFSDQVGRLLFTDPGALTQFQTWKGFGFVSASAAVLFFAAWRRRPRARVGADASPGLPLATLLSMIVLATSLPLVALLGWNITRETQAHLRGANALMRSVAEGAAADAARLLGEQRHVLADLVRRAGARRPATVCESLDQLATPELRDRLAVYDGEGRFLCGPPSRRSAAPPPWMEELRLERDAVVGPVEAVGGTLLVGVAHPLRGRDEHLDGAIELLVPASALASAVDAVLPEHGSLALLDQRRVFVARSTASDLFVGTPARDEDVLREAGPRTLVVRGRDGVARLIAVAPVGRTGWVTGAGVPVDAIYGPARRALVRSVLVSLAVLGVCVWLVLRLARSITGPLGALRRTAERASTGRFDERAPEAGPAELATVASGFNRMMEKLPQLQQQLREGEARQREMFEKLSRNLPGLIYVSRVAPGGRRGSYPLVSSGLQQLFELEPAQIRSDIRPVLARIHPADRGRVLREIRAAGDELRPFAIEYRVLLPASGLRHHLTQAHPERIEGGVTVWYGSVVDVSELRAAQQALEHANATLEERIAQRTAALAASNEALESFSYSVAHDLRAPLASIDGFAQGMVQSLRKGDVARALAHSERVVANAQRMNLLIEGFLALARASRAPLVDSPVDLQRLVQEVLAELPRPHTARVDVEPLPRVHADQATIRQVWQNLLSNALKYSGRREQPWVRVRYHTARGELVFRVEDNGAGFDPDYADKLFTPFGRLHKAEEFEGTGVGLALVRRIVERHGGRIWAESRPGEGATFFFSMPRARLL